MSAGGVTAVPEHGVHTGVLVPIHDRPPLLQHLSPPDPL